MCMSYDKIDKIAYVLHFQLLKETVTHPFLDMEEGRPSNWNSSNNTNAEEIDGNSPTCSNFELENAIRR